MKTLKRPAPKPYEFHELVKGIEDHLLWGGRTKISDDEIKAAADSLINRRQKERDARRHIEDVVHRHYINKPPETKGQD